MKATWIFNISIAVLELLEDYYFFFIEAGQKMRKIDNTI